MRESFEPSYIMPVDADDCLSKHLAEFVNRNSHCNGWFINKGYEYQEGSRLIYLRQEDFFVRCGTLQYQIQLAPST